MCVVYDNEIRMSFGYVHEWIEVMFHHVSALEVSQKDYAEVRHDITEILLSKVRVKQSINQSVMLMQWEGDKMFHLVVSDVSQKCHLDAARS